MRHITDGRGACWASLAWKDRITNVEVRTRTGQLQHTERKTITLAWTCSAYAWTISAYHSKHCTGRYKDIKKDQVDQKQTGGAQSTKT